MEHPSILSRVSRHLRLTRQALRRRDHGTPPFLVLFVNSICNLHCDHCFYWRNLNQRNDLSFEEIVALSEDLGPVENLNLSGGEPFLRPDLDKVVKQFINHNGVRQVYVPTNGFFLERTEKAVRSILQEESLMLFVCEISLDGTEAYHNEFRGNKKSFENAMATYDMLAELQKEDPRLRIHSISTATNQNIDEIRSLTDYLYERCSAMDHHNLAVVRGDRKDNSLLAPSSGDYGDLHKYIESRWSKREEGRFGAIVEPMLQWCKIQTMEKKTQVIPCRGGVMAGVVYANGDVSVCELHEPLGNLRDKTFRELWHSKEATDLRQAIAAKQCWCTTEVFMWPSIVFQPVPLARAMVGGKVWKKAPSADPLPAAPVREAPE